MIKKIFHYLCVLIAGALFSALLLLIYQQLFLLCYQINLLAPQTYASIRNYWNDGGVLRRHFYAFRNYILFSNRVLDMAQTGKIPVYESDYETAELDI